MVHQIFMLSCCEIIICLNMWKKSVCRIWRLTLKMSSFYYWEQQSSAWPLLRNTLRRFCAWLSTSWGQTNGLLLELSPPGQRWICSVLKRNTIAETVSLWIVPLLETLLETMRKCFLRWSAMGIFEPFLLDAEEFIIWIICCLVWDVYCMDRCTAILVSFFLQCFWYLASC